MLKSHLDCLNPGRPVPRESEAVAALISMHYQSSTLLSQLSINRLVRGEIAGSNLLSISRHDCLPLLGISRGLGHYLPSFELFSGIHLVMDFADLLSQAFFPGFASKSV